MKNSKTLVLMILLFGASLVVINACDNEEKDLDAGEDASVDASDDSGIADGFTCLECHIDEELLLADLEAVPTPRTRGAAGIRGRGVSGRASSVGGLGESKDRRRVSR